MLQLSQRCVQPTTTKRERVSCKGDVLQTLQMVRDQNAAFINKTQISGKDVTKMHNLTQYVSATGDGKFTATSAEGLLCAEIMEQRKRVKNDTAAKERQQRRDLEVAALQEGEGSDEEGAPQQPAETSLQLLHFRADGGGALYASAVVISSAGAHYTCKVCFVIIAALALTRHSSTSSWRARRQTAPSPAATPCSARCGWLRTRSG